MPTRKGGPRPSRRLAPPTIDAATAAAVSSSMPEPTESASSATPVAERDPLRNARFPLGVDVYPLDAEGDAPADAYARDLSGQFDQMAASGISLVRLFAPWRAIEPQVGRYDEEVMSRFASALADAGARGMRAVVVLFSAEPISSPSSVAWGQKRDVRSEPYMVERAAEFAAFVASRLRTERALFGWQIADEPFCERFDDAVQLAEWASRMRESIRGADPGRPIALGCDPESLARATRMDARAAIAGHEFALAHPSESYRALVAPGPAFVGPPTRLRGFLIQAARRGMPVISDQVGADSLDASPAEEAAELGLELATSLVHGAASVMLRRWSDLETEPREPYFVEPFEQPVGVTDAEGRPKAAHAALVAFAKSVAAVDLAGTDPVPERLAVLMGGSRFAELPSIGSIVTPRAAFAAWRLARECQLPATVAYADDDLSAYACVLVPSGSDVDADTWDRLSTYVSRGGTLLLSFGGDDADAGMRELFGVEFLGDSGPRDGLEVRVAQPDLLPGVESFDADLDLAAFAMLAPGDATVIATDGRGNPLLTTNAFGQGRAVLLATPLERAIGAADARVISPSAIGFARAVVANVGRSAGCAAPVESDDADVEIGLLQGAEEDVLVVANHAREPRTPQISSARVVVSIVDVATGAETAIGTSVFTLPLGPSATSLLRLRYR